MTIMEGMRNREYKQAIEGADQRSAEKAARYESPIAELPREQHAHQEAEGYVGADAEIEEPHQSPARRGHRSRTRGERHSRG